MHIGSKPPDTSNWACLSRRKKKAVHKVSTTDDKRLQATLKRLGVNTIPGIEEVNLFHDNDVIHFTNPKGGESLPQQLMWSKAFILVCQICTCVGPDICCVAMQYKLR